jgi:AraC family transcriptional regulator
MAPSDKPPAPGPALPAAQPPPAEASFVGEVAAQRRGHDLLLTELCHPARRAFPHHAHRYAYLSLLLAGGYREQAAGRALVQRPLAVTFHPPDLEHRDEVAEGGVRLLCVEVGESWLGHLREEGPLALDLRALPGGEAVRLAVRLFRELRQWDEATSPLLAEGLAVELLARAASRARRRPVHERHPPAWLGRVEELLRATFHHPPGLERLAAEAGVHPVHLARTFRHFRGCTLGAYVQELRVRRVWAGAADPRLSLADLALEAGFADQSHCTRVFRQRTGVTPGALRRWLA